MVSATLESEAGSDAAGVPAPRHSGVHRPPGRRRHPDQLPRRPPLDEHHPRAHVLDWEGWGSAPCGYDAATLYMCALFTPETAARIRTGWPPSSTDPRPAPAC